MRRCIVVLGWMMPIRKQVAVFCTLRANPTAPVSLRGRNLLWRRIFAFRDALLLILFEHCPVKQILSFRYIYCDTRFSLRNRHCDCVNVWLSLYPCLTACALYAQLGMAFAVWRNTRRSNCIVQCDTRIAVRCAYCESHHFATFGGCIYFPVCFLLGNASTIYYI